MPWSLAGAAASIGGSLLGRSSARAANVVNTRLAREQMAFQERMRATQYQTAVKDMQRAGLNPMLAYTQGGAGTPPGAMARVEPEFDANTGARLSDSFATAVQVKNQSDLVRSQIANMEADTAGKLAMVDKILADTQLSTQQAHLTSAQRTTESYRPQHVTSQANLFKAQAEQIDKLLFDTMAKIRAETAREHASAQQIRAQNVLMKELQNNPYTSWWAPYLLDAFRPGR